MQTSDYPEFLRVVNGLAVMKPGANTLTPEALDMWWLSLADWTIEEFRAAAAQLAVSVEFMPNPYHFAQLRKKASTEVCGEAWGNLLLVIRRSGYGRENLSPKVERVIAAMGGWSVLSMMKTEELPFREKRFRELWEEIGDVDEARKALPSASMDAGVKALIRDLARGTEIP
jgi:hypothetical protein